MTFLDFVQLLADKVEMVANIILIAVAWKWWRCQQMVTISLSIGTFRVKRKDVDLPTLTAIVSRTFFKGGWLPDDVRHELLAITTPEIKDLNIFETKGCGTPPPQK